jgi:hypothetical protein
VTNKNKAILEAVRDKINNDPSYVHAPSLGNDIEAVLLKHPDGCTDRVIASLLQIEVEDVANLYEEIVNKLRIEMKVENG